MVKDLINNHLEPISYLIAALAILYSIHKSAHIKKWVLFFYFISSFAIFFIGVKDFYTGSNNIDLYNYHFFSTFLFIGIYYYLILKTAILKKIVIVFMLSNAVYFIYTNLFYSSNKTFDSLGISFLSLGIVILFFSYCYQILKTVDDSKPILSSFDFWVNISLIILHLGSFVIFISFDYLTRIILNQSTLINDINRLNSYKHSLSDLWGIHNILLFISALSLVIGLKWVTSVKKY